MKLARFDNDRLGVVIGANVHDITDIQTQIRAAHPYATYADAVIAALPTWRGKMEDAAKKAPGKPIASVKLLSPIARPPKNIAAPTNYAAHIAEMAKRREEGMNIGTHSPKIKEAGIFLKSNTSIVGPSEGIPIRFPERRNEHEAELVVIIGKQGTDIPIEQGDGLYRRLLPRPRHDDARAGRPLVPQVDRRLLGAGPVVRHRRRDQETPATCR